jgi:acetylcholinesterase
MALMLLKLGILASLALASPLAASRQVTLPYGVTIEPVKDYQETYGIKLGKPLLAYFAIPYAEPPVGKLRFQHPQPPKKRDDKILNNTAFGPICLQGSKGKQSEDCLTLSVFKPQNADPRQRLPVLIWTHGGGFNVGSGGGSFVPAMVGNAPHDYIAVTFNYRLGAFGFLPSNLTEKAGLLNLGLEDQVMAYEWVQKHIGIFGGDPTKITVSPHSSL